MSFASRTAATLNTRTITPQTMLIPGREAELGVNDAGGIAFKVSNFDFLDRFLIIGAEGGTFYASEKKTLARSVPTIDICLKEDWKRTIDRAVEVSIKGLALNNDNALIVLAKAASSQDKVVRKYALSKVSEVARIGTHLFHFMGFLNGLRGKGRLVKEALQNWYLSKQADQLAYQVVKYKSRDGWSHRDILRLVRPKASSVAMNSVLKYAVKKELDEHTPKVIVSSEIALLNKDNIEFLVGLIHRDNLTWEMLPSECLKDKRIWEALLDNMPLTAMIRNLGRMSALGMFNVTEEEPRFISKMEQELINAGLKKAEKIGNSHQSNLNKVLEKLENVELIQRSRIHPIQVLIAYKTYSLGKGLKGDLTWRVNNAIKTALEDVFYKSFQNVTPTGKKFLLALDVSGSMRSAAAGDIGLTASEVAAAFAMVIKRTESQSYIMGFDRQFKDLQITASDTLGTAMKKAHSNTFGRTDCSAPMVWAKLNKLDVDVFVVITDNETYAGNIHPSQALKQFNASRQIPAKLVVLATSVNRFTIADPKNPDMLDIAGFSPDVPKVINWFATGKAEVPSQED